MVLSPVPAPIAAAYAADTFRKHGHAIVDLLADQLAAASAKQVPVLPWQPPAQALARWQQCLQPQAATAADPMALLANVVAGSTALHHPGFAGHQVAPALPLGALTELVAAHLNNGVGIYEMGPAGVPIELVMVAKLAAVLGLPADAGGCFTSGGSLGNLTALLAMRQRQAPGDVWHHGNPPGVQFGVIASSQLHYSVARSVQIMGWGKAGVVVAGVDEAYRLTAAHAVAALAQARAAGITVLGVVASAGSTATGAVDCLAELADFAAANNLWLHVDGAHGASLALARQPRLRDQLQGIERADSVVWDAHKMLMMPALVTAVLFRESRNAYAAFAQQASYLFANRPPAQTWWDLGQRTVECTKRMMATELFVAWQTYGQDFFAALVERQCDIALAFAELLATTPGFTLLRAPNANIVCYRAAGSDALQSQIRDWLNQRGHHYIVTTMVGDRMYLRSAFMNPLATAGDLLALCQALQEAAQACAGDAEPTR